MGSTEKWPSTENTRDVNHDHDEWAPPRNGRLPRIPEMSPMTMTNGLHREVAVCREHQRCQPGPWRMGSTEKWPSTENTRDVNQDHDEWDPPRNDRLPRKLNDWCVYDLRLPLRSRGSEKPSWRRCRHSLQQLTTIVDWEHRSPTTLSWCPAW